MLLQQGQQLTVGQLGGIEGQLGILGLGVALGLFHAVFLGFLGVGIAFYRSDVDGAVLEENLLHLVLFHHFDHLAVLDLVAGGLVGGIAGVSADVIHGHRQHHGPGNQRQDAPQAVVVFVVLIVAVIVVICHKTLLGRAEVFCMRSIQASITQRAESHKRHVGGFSVKFL